MRNHLRAAVLAAAVGLGCASSPQSTDPLERARRLMEQVPLIDGHNDLPWELRERFHSSFDSLDLARPQPELMTDIPRLRQGMVGAQFWSTYSPSEIEHPARVGMEQVDIVRRMAERYPDVFVMAGTADDIERIHREGKIASLAGLEGGHMIENSLGLLRAYYREGVRYMTLTHNSSVDWADAATGTQTHGGLTPFGEAVIREMNRLGMLVDLSHASDSTMWDVLRVTEAPVIYSHSSARALVPHLRNVPDDIARAVAENGGVIMVNYYPLFDYRPTYDYALTRDSMAASWRRAGVGDAALADSLKDWESQHPVPLPDLAVIADHIEHFRDVAGVDHVGIGSDLDGIDFKPVGLEDVSKFPDLIAELLRRGWSDEDAKKVIGLNVLRVMREAEAVAKRSQESEDRSQTS
ncbi:MAG: dipeptidase [Gemmatimonadales bacterium]|nr:dipeptidase [Gemmatimonadales bacterium]